jgi:hypothetical protein
MKKEGIRSGKEEQSYCFKLRITCQFFTWWLGDTRGIVTSIKEKKVQFQSKETKPSQYVLP